MLEKLKKIKLKKFYKNFIVLKLIFLLKPIIYVFFKIFFKFIVFLRAPSFVNNKFKIKFDYLRVCLIKYLVSKQVFKDEIKLKSLFLKKISENLNLIIRCLEITRNTEHFFALKKILKVLNYICHMKIL